MSHSLLGGDPAEMQAMAAQFTQQADQVRTTMTNLDREAAKVGTATLLTEDDVSSLPRRLP